MFDLPPFLSVVRTIINSSLIHITESISRGYAEVYLPELLTSSVGGCSSELLRCIPLDPKQHSSSTLGIAASVGGSGGGKWEFTSNPVSSSTSLTIRKPTITAEVLLVFQPKEISFRRLDF